MSHSTIAVIRYRFSNEVCDWNRAWTKITTRPDGSEAEERLIWSDSPEFFKFLFERLNNRDIEFANPEDAEGFYERWENAKQSLFVDEKNSAGKPSPAPA